MTNPVLAEVTRGNAVESRHLGAFCVMGPGGTVLASAGDIIAPIFPRSAIKAFQALPLLESGAADRYGFTDEEIALCVSSHNGEPDHLRVARSMLAKAGVTEADYECGSHWPYDLPALRDMIAKGETPHDVHNNCSGKHAGMLAFAKASGVDLKGYVGIEHPVQQAVAKTMGEICDVDLSEQIWGIDGCSVPTWALPLKNLARGFQRLASGEDLSETRKAACQRIIKAACAHPFMVAGTDRFCTDVMKAVPRAFVKTGAEGVFCGAVPHAGIGIAVKCDDGTHRASETAMAAVLAGLDCWTAEERAALQGFARQSIKSRKGVEIGEVRAVISS
ncbi:MAG: asparaginase [Aestuariivirgaceae bacterium]|nr:asparaginase [Aestuariivirgaceae bacterium]